MPKYKLIYFDSRGCGEPIRLIFAYTGTPYEDVRLPLGKLTAERIEELGLEWGVLPVLEIDGKRIAQSWAISRFLAKKFGLAGRTEEEQYRCEEVVEAIRDVYIRGLKLNDYSFGKDKKKFIEDITLFIQIDCPTYFIRFNDLLEKQGKTWLVGDDLTYADLYLEHMCTHIEMSTPSTVTEKYPALLKLITSVRNHPKLKQWYQERPVNSI